MFTQPHDVRRARQWARLEGERAGWLTEAQLFDLTLGVTELLTNAFEHAGTDALVILQSDEASFHVEVQDTNPRQVPVLESGCALSESGRGLHLIDSLAARWGYDTTAMTKSVWFELGAT
jgi:anti-sigma regulatory factor (Ser/Thr protein kinase)